MREGTRTDAIRFALSANAKHGLKRTPADIRRCLEVAWENRAELFGGEPSHEVLASACNVSTKTVQRFFRRREAAEVDSVHPSGSVTKSKVDSVHPEEPVRKARAPWEKDPIGFGSHIFKDFCDEGEEKARDLYIDSRYGTFGEYPSWEWKKDRLGRSVPNGIRAIIDRAIMDDYDTLYSCVRKAYDILQQDSDAPFLKQLLSSECKPLELISRIYEAVENADLVCICDKCNGKGCDVCDHKGYKTMADSRRRVKH